MFELFCAFNVPPLFATHHPPLNQVAKGAKASANIAQVTGTRTILMPKSAITSTASSEQRSERRKDEGGELLQRCFFENMSFLFGAFLLWFVVVVVAAVVVVAVVVGAVGCLYLES